MQQEETAAEAKRLAVRSLPAVVGDGNWRDAVRAVGRPNRSYAKRCDDRGAASTAN